MPMMLLSSNASIIRSMSAMRVSIAAMRAVRPVSSSILWTSTRMKRRCACMLRSSMAVALRTTIRLCSSLRSSTSSSVSLSISLSLSLYKPNSSMTSSTGGGGGASAIAASLMRSSIVRASIWGIGLSLPPTLIMKKSFLCEVSRL